MEIINQKTFVIRIVQDFNYAQTVTMQTIYSQWRKLIHFFTRTLHKQKLSGFNRESSLWVIDYAKIQRPVDLGYERKVFRKHKVVGEKKATSNLMVGYIIILEFMGFLDEVGKAGERLTQIIKNLKTQYQIIGDVELILGDQFEYYGVSD